MIQELSIKIKDGGLTHTISIDTDIDGNLPYDLVCAIEKVFNLTRVNTNTVIEQLLDTYGLPERFKQKNDTEKPSYVIRHSADNIPCVNRAIYVVFEDDDKKSFIINDISSDSDWLKYAKDNKVKEWCYLNEVLKEGYKI